jgi:hypothetical protein
LHNRLLTHLQATEKGKFPPLDRKRPRVISAQLWSNAIPTGGSEVIQSEQNINTPIVDLGSQLRQKEEEMPKVKREISEQIQRPKSELQKMQIQVNAKEKQTRGANRRHKRRIYFP